LVFTASLLNVLHLKRFMRR